MTITPTLARRALEVYRGERRAVPAGEVASPFVLLALEADTARVAVPDILPNMIMATDEIRIERPLRVGETFQASGVLLDIQEHYGGRFGLSLIIRVETQFHDASGALVAAAARSMMQYDRPSGESGESGE